MKSIQELSSLISDELSSIKYPKTHSSLYEPIEYILGLGGKAYASNFGFNGLSIIWQEY